MKKLLIVLTLVTTSFTIAQSDKAQSLTYGIKGGVSFARFNGDISAFAFKLDPKFFTGFTAGAFVNYMVNDKFSIQPELLFSRKGSKFKQFKLDDFNLLGEVAANVLNVELDIYAKMDWLEIPILGIYKVDDKFSIYGGPYIGFYLGGKGVAEISVSVLGRDFDQDIVSDDLSLPDFGIIFGGTYSLSNNVALEARYSYGFQDIADNVIVDFLDDDVIVTKNSALQLLLEITF